MASQRAPSGATGGVHRGVPDPSPALADALRQVGDRWTLTVVAALLSGPQRFGELEAAIPGLSTNVLTDRLRQLERRGLVVSTVYSERPRRSDYHLTAAGAELAGALRLLAAWGAGPGGNEADAPTHAVCGAPLEVRWWCPTCGRVADDDEEEIWT